MIKIKNVSDRNKNDYTACENCNTANEATQSYPNVGEIYEITVGYTKLRLCKSCVRKLSEKLDKIN
jgi:hypothetical protein